MTYVNGELEIRLETPLMSHFCCARVIKVWYIFFKVTLTFVSCESIKSTSFLRSHSSFLISVMPELRYCVYLSGSL